MAKLFKNSKQIFAFVIAFAIIAVSLFTGVVINSEAASGTTEKKIVYRSDWISSTQNSDADGSFMTGDTAVGDGSKENPYIISTVEHLRYLAQYSTYATTHGKYFKIDDSIDIFVMQSQSKLTANGKTIEDVLALSSGQTTREFFTTYTSEWDQWQGGSTTGEYFGGHLDGNGVEIVGMYTKAAGLFGNVSEGATLSNITVKNSYVRAGDYASALVGYGSASKTYKDKNLNNENCDGYVTFEKCVVKNSYIASTGSANASRVGVMMGGGASFVNVKMSDCIVYGNIAQYEAAQEANCVEGGLFGALSTGHNGDPAGYYNCDFDNCIILDCVPYASEGTSPNQAFKAAYYSNIYTNRTSEYRPCGPNGGSSWADWLEKTNKDGTSRIIIIDSADAIGLGTETNLSTLDWEKTWIANANGYPELRVFHGEIVFTNNATTHYYACTECDLITPAEDHVWNVDTCTVCSYRCIHNGAGDQVIEERRATCVTKQGTYTYCKNCEWTQEDTWGSVDGHVLEWVKEIPAECEHEGGKEGREGYWHCKQCGGNYQADSEEAAIWAPMESNIADPDTQLIIPLGPHNATNREDGSILVKSDETGHWWLCYTCDGRLEAIESEEYADEGDVKKHDFEESVCLDCGWKCTEHNYESTGYVVVAGTCYVDHQEELKCTICGDKKVAVTPATHNIKKVDEVPANDKLEGTKAHYKCLVCQEMYVDAEGKTKATAAELVIAKVLPAGYENQVIGGSTANTDTSTKSPATGDSVASVLAVATLAGAALVITRKVRK